MSPEPSQVRQLKVLIGYPSDAKAERDAIASELDWWNEQVGAPRGISLLRLRWPENAVATSVPGGDAQASFDETVADQTDILFAVFKHSAGSPTQEGHPSGTYQEIDHALKAGRPVHVFFTSENAPVDQSNAEAMQRSFDRIRSVREVRRLLESRVLTLEFRTVDELRSLVRDAIEFDVARLLPGRAGPPPANAADPASPSGEGLRPASQADPTVRVFISYHRADNDAYDGIATKLHALLPQRYEARTGTPMDAYLDTESNVGGELWHDRMIREAAAAAVFLPLVTMRYLKSKHCIQELHAFLDRPRPSTRVSRVIPVIVDGRQQLEQASSDEARLVAARQYIDFTDAVDADISSARWKDKIRELITQIELVVALPGA